MGYLSYLAFMLPALVFGLIAQWMVKSRFKKFSKIASKRGMTGADAARAVLNAGGVYNVGIGRVSGDLTDNFNPTTNMISLSDTVYDNTSVAAIGVAAHEAGHALQYAENYAPIKFRMSILPICNIGSKIGPLLIIIGCFISFSAESVNIELGQLIYFIGLILFGAVAVFQIATLPVELNASKRALKALSSGALLDSRELSDAKKVLTAAALTYVAALVTSIMQVLYYATRFKPNNRR